MSIGLTERKKIKKERKENKVIAGAYWRKGLLHLYKAFSDIQGKVMSKVCGLGRPQIREAARRHYGLRN